MNAAATDRETVLRVAREAERRLRAEAAPDTPNVHTANSVEAGALAAQLERALTWAATDEERLAAEGEIEDLEPGMEYISRDPVLSLVQSAIDAGALPAADVATAAAAEDAAAATNVDVVTDFLRFLFVPKRPFRSHESLQDFRFPLPDACTVALVADWGTGMPGAVRVMEQIAARRPQHLVHLGDIYPSGDVDEVRRHFTRVLDEHGPPECKVWAMNGNHEMIAKGTGYFDAVLPFCGQPASYFSLGNAHWRLIALDSAYNEYRLREPQPEWAVAQLAEEGPRNILLTHHQVFSAVDVRPSRHHTDIELGQLAVSGAVFGWFWGHEHGGLVYDRAPEFGGMRARCIGHGGKKIKLPYFTGAKHPAPPVARHWEEERPGEPGIAMNGFALLRFDGPVLDIDYVDENGGTWFSERWRADK
ncbi:MAG TPA: metallophosphoesterase [Longimicrobium sp.]|nr:metallophosphoesterase [Longimicrobium sp.]